MRLDVWLDVACLFRTRSEAQRACRGGKVEVNGGSAKPHRDVREGDEILITRPLGRRQRVRVVRLEERHVPKAEARTLYDDLTPPPTPEEIEMRRLARLARPFVSPSGMPHRRDRRLLRRMRGKG
ncbi:MAG TPA: S4 domain-containing protein [Vicinamibacterales bacterium]|nr:S4 domain-containing protein [Vicinamibacterales bacterium]